MYLKVGATARGRNRDRDFLFAVSLLTRSHQPGLSHSAVRSQGLLSGLPHKYQRIKHLAIFSCFFQAIYRELDQKWTVGTQIRIYDVEL